jgi:hypothetical protein
MICQMCALRTNQYVIDRICVDCWQEVDPNGW